MAGSLATRFESLRNLPLCPVCLREIGPKDRVSGSPDEPMHATCDYAGVRRPQRQPLVLVVDDNDDHRAMYAMYLQAAGFRVVEAADGTSAVGKASALHPDVVLLDLYMPGLNGWQACRWLKSSIQTAGIRVVAITGHAVEPARRQAMEAGCDRFIVKGANPDDVVQAIREILA